MFQSQNGGTNVLLNRAKQWLSIRGFEVINFDDCEKIINKEIDLVLLPTSEMHRLPQLWNKNLEIKHTLIWAMGSLAFQGAFSSQTINLFVYKVLAFPLRILGKKLLSSLLSDRAVIFTDEVGMYADVQCLKFKPTNINDLIFPIAVDVQYDIPRPVFPHRPRRFMWIGRVDKDFKVLPLLRAIRDVSSALNRGVLQGEIEFTIIGAGDGDELVRKEIALTADINFKWKDEVKLSDLPDMLTKNVDVLIAMGTSALEGARCGIPTVIVQPFSHHKQEPELPYRWIHQTVGHSLGEFPWVRCEPSQPKCGFDALWNSSTLDELSLKSFAFSQKFNSDDVFAALVNRPLSEALSSRSRLLLRMHTITRILKNNLRKLVFRVRSI